MEWNGMENLKWTKPYSSWAPSQLLYNDVTSAFAIRLFEVLVKLESMPNARSREFKFTVWISGMQKPARL